MAAFAHKLPTFAPMENNEFGHLLAGLNIKSLNRMQLAAIEASAIHNNILLLSNTGSGKTLAFLLPLVKSLDVNLKATQALIIAPSRELALQIEQVFKKLSSGFKITACYGGHLRETEENNLLEAPAVIVGTPGRLADHLRRSNIKTEKITTLVLDEFDKSLEAGFEEEVAFVISHLGKLTKRILTSATGNLDIPGFVEFDDPQKLDFLTEEPNEALAIQLLRTAEKDKIDALFSLLCMVDGRSAIVFCNHRDAVERTSELLKERGIFSVFYHGALEQPQRDSALFKFKNGTFNTLITTDLASRGLDIPNIRYIIHYHLPGSEEIFTHRNGRTARMEASGTVILMLGPGETLPDYIPADLEEINLPEENLLPDAPKWATLFIAAGKKDKVNKIDIVGFLTNKGQLKKEDIGLIEVKDFHSFAAIRKSKMSHTLNLIKAEKIKNKRVKMEIAK